MPVTPRKLRRKDVVHPSHNAAMVSRSHKSGSFFMVILFVEDEPAVLIMTSGALSDAGFEVIEVADGAAAIALISLQSTAYTALITDFRLINGTTGGNVIEAFRPIYPEAPILMTTAFRQPVSVSWMEHYRVVLINKPFTTAALLLFLSGSLVQTQQIAP